MFFINSLRPDFVNSSFVAALSNSISHYSLPIIALSCLWLYRERIYSYAQNVARNLPFFSNRIKVGSENSQINHLIKDYFENNISKLEREEKYNLLGREDYSFPETNKDRLKLVKNLVENPIISALDFIEEQLQQRTKKGSFKILDLGTGNGKFLISCYNRFKNYEIEAQGISAFDTKNQLFYEASQFLDDKYFIGDINRLFETLPQMQKESFDVIVSSYTFRHLIDPLKSLISAYDVLKENGKMLIGHFKLYGISIEDFELFLEKNGYKYQLATYLSKENTREIDYLILEKTKPKLDFPIYYKLPPISSKSILGTSWVRMQYQKV